MLEQIEKCQTLIFDKTGTLTYGRPKLTQFLCEPTFRREQVLQLVASAEQYSKHPLADAIVFAAKQEKIPLLPVDQISERPGQGLRGIVAGHTVFITGRNKMAATSSHLPPTASGLECVVFVDNKLAAAVRFHDAPRKDSAPFIQHLQPKHGVARVMLVSGDRESEVKYLAESVGISEVTPAKLPKRKWLS